MEFSRKKVALIAIVCGLILIGLDATCGGGGHGLLAGTAGIMGIFGFIGAWVLIIISKMILMHIVQRDLDYYEKGDED